MDEEAAANEAEAPKHTVVCWACNLVVVVPIVDGESAPLFKCGWCGAVTQLTPGTHPLDTTFQQKHRMSKNYVPRTLLHQLLPGLEKLTWLPINWSCNRCLRYCNNPVCCGAFMVARWFMVLFVTALSLFIILGGSMFMLPKLCNSWFDWAFHSPITVFLSVSVLYNYFATVFGSPGTVMECMPHPSEQYTNGQVPGPGSTTVAQYAFNDYTFCSKCKYMKPPEVHHCSMCNKCIVDMDHHCPFVNNCVGRSNLRNFFLFLTWTVVSCLYVLVLASVLLWKEWPHTRVLVDGAITDLGSVRGMQGYLLTLAYLANEAPTWLLLVYFLLVLSFVVLVGVASLLGGQLRMIAQGVGYISYLKGHSMTERSSFSANLGKLLGGRNAVDWIALRWGPAASALPRRTKKWL